jgi:hypothetical protein
MGLDVYLSRIEDFERVKAKEKEYEKITNRIWNSLFGELEYNDAPEEDREKFSKELEKIKTAMGLSRYGTDTSRENVCINSAKYPDHTFKIGYFRSSYNGSGFNSITEQTIGMSLYNVFEPSDGNYEEVPDWSSSKERAQLLINELNRVQKEAPYIAESFNNHNFEDLKIPNSDKEALDIFMKQFESHKTDPFGDSYSCQQGMFHLKEPLKIFGLMHGKSIFMNEDCVYYILKMDYSWYIQAAEIVLETIDYVLAQDHPEWYVLAWSG